MAKKVSGFETSGGPKMKEQKGFEASGGPRMKEHAGPDVAPNNPVYGKEKGKRFNTGGPKVSTYYKEETM